MVAAGSTGGTRSLAMTDAGSAADSERLRVLALLKRYGWNATSFQILEPGFRYWFDERSEETGGRAPRGIDERSEACVGYVDTGRAWVAAGSPVAAPERF